MSAPSSKLGRGRRADGQTGRRADGQTGRRADGQTGSRAAGQTGTRAKRANGQNGQSGQAGKRAGGNFDRSRLVMSPESRVRVTSHESLS
jgi:hypothetical protein